MKKVDLKDVNEEVQKRTHKQIKECKDLDHENIIHTEDSILDNQHLYVISDYATEGTLAKYVKTFSEKNIKKEDTEQQTMTKRKAN